MWQISFPTSWLVLHSLCGFFWWRKVCNFDAVRLISGFPFYGSFFLCLKKPFPWYHKGSFIHCFWRFCLSHVSIVLICIDFCTGCEDAIWFCKIVWAPLIEWLSILSLIIINTSPFISEVPICVHMFLTLHWHLSLLLCKYPGEISHIIALNL